LHHQTALLPRIELAKPRRVVGKSTVEAMISGAVYGYVGMIREILEQVEREAFPGRKPCVIATGGDALKLAKLLPLFDIVKPSLTLDGLRLIAALNPVAKMKENARQMSGDS
jgi:type III pantothenate kinase